MPTVRDLLERYEYELEQVDGKDSAIAMTRACDHLLEQMEREGGGS